MASCTTYKGPTKGKQPKAKYDSRAEAEAAISKLYELRSDDNRALQAYRCPKCRYWHFGKLTARKRDSPAGRLKQKESREENLVGMLIGILRGTYPSPQRRRSRS